jgi:subtilisin family serine protease
MQGTVNPSASAYEGSNPSRRTSQNTQHLCWVFCFVTMPILYILSGMNRQKGIALALAIALLQGAWAPVLADEQSTSTLVVQTATSTPETVGVIVKFKDSALNLETEHGKNVTANLAETAGASVASFITDSNTAVLTVATGTAQIVSDQLASNPNVEYAEPDVKRSFTFTTTDQYNALQWSLENTGQNILGVVGTAGADIKAVSAWSRSTGTSTLVAVIDNGVLYTHPDLSANMWDGTTCVDDTGAPLGGCIHGYNFSTTTSTNNPLPTGPFTAGSHGTHVAGIIAAGIDNGVGIVGVAPSAKIMAVKFDLYVSSEVRAINFARLNGAKVINASYGGSQFSQAEHDAIQQFTNSGGIFVAAAGNDSTSNDVTATYPASYDIPGIIRVAATDQNDQLASYSNYGPTTVDLEAPGSNILSTFTSDGASSTYAYLSGTSMATPEVVGVVALIEALHPALSSSDVKKALLLGGDSIPSLATTTLSGKRLNAFGALYYSDDLTPPVITLIGSSTISYTIGTSTFVDPGATAFDAYDATSTSVTVATSTVSTSSPGTYGITYQSSDVRGNIATTSRTVSVVAATTTAVGTTTPVVVPAPAPVSGGGGGGSGGGGSSSSRGGGSSSPTTVVATTPITRTLFTATTTPLVTPVYTLARPLFYGMTGADVTALQQALTSIGSYTGPITGYYGSLTQAAIRAYQTARGLAVLGSVDQTTWQKINAEVNTPQVAVAEMTPAQLQAEIALLKQLIAALIAKLSKEGGL